MCLFKSETEPRCVETGPLKVYKVLRENDRSPVIGGFTYKRGMNRPLPESCNDDSMFIIDGGYLHAFLAKPDAEFFMGMLVNDPWNIEHAQYKIVEMYIPVGSIYWRGLGGEIAASSLYWPEENDDQ